MFEKEIPVLLVDDEPDILAVSQLAMKDFEVFGLPVRLYTAESKAKAIELLESEFAVAAQIGAKLNVAFIDVVMETDPAGLELCDYIRNTLGNRFTQIYIRTGQPGMARSASDRPLRHRRLLHQGRGDRGQALHADQERCAPGLLHRPVTRPQPRPAGAHRRRGPRADGADAQAQLDVWDVDFRIGYAIDGEVIARGIDEQQFMDLRDALGQQSGKTLNGAGDSYVIDGNQLLLRIAGSDTSSESTTSSSATARRPRCSSP
jgi:CheY-like chemotaxis protein